MTHPSPDAAAVGVLAAAAGPAPGAWNLRACWQPTSCRALAGDVLDVGTGEGASLIHLPNSARVVLLEPQPRSASTLNS